MSNLFFLIDQVKYYLFASFWYPVFNLYAKDPLEGDQVKLQTRVGPPGCYFWSAIEQPWAVAQGLLSPYILFPGPC